MLLDRLNKFARVHFQQILCGRHLISRTHSHVKAGRPLLILNNPLDMIIAFGELFFQLFKLITDSLLYLLFIQVPGLRYILMQVLVTHRVLDSTIVNPNSIIVQVRQVQLLQQLFFHLA